MRWVPFFLASCLWAGTCPSGANYLNPSTMSMVTLASLGITNCYYIAANGSDSNDGASEASGHPWLHAPAMPSCTANCANVTTTCNNNGCAGYGFIFRGGDTWHFGATTTPSTGGTWNWSAGTGGTLNNPIYVGVDQGWYTGTSWTRPIMTGDNPVCGPSTVGGNCSQGSLSTYNVKQYYVSSCAYQAGSNNALVQTAGSSHYIFDNFEMTGLCQKDAGTLNDNYFAYGSSGDIKFLNLYLHGWTHVYFADVNGGGNCGICFNTELFAGGNNQTPDDVFRYVIVDGSDSDPVGAGACYCDWNDVAYSYFGNQSQGIARYPHLFHDNLYEYWYENGHGNVLESVGDESGTNVVYNNIFRHINTLDDPGDPLIWMLPDTSTTDYFFNNLVYDVGTMEYFIAGNNGSNQGTYTVFNNTFQSNDSGNGISCSATGNSSSLYLVNNHYISDGTGFTINSSSNCNSRLKAQTTNLTLTNSQATTDGYTSSEVYAYSPNSASSPTVGLGTNEQGYCTALSSAGLSAAATACQSDTTYACSYNTGSHTVSCPDRTVIARPPTNAWNIGTYQASTTGSAPSAPTALVAVSQ